MHKCFTIILIGLTLLILNTVFAQSIAEGKDKFLGCAYSTAQAPDFDEYWNQVTPENGGKWGSVEGSRDQMNWSAANEAYNFAKDRGFKFRFHVLVWGNQQPNWIKDLEPAEQLEEIEEWFAAVAEQFPDIDYLEVVNEPLHDPPDDPEDGGYINALGGTDSLYGTGWDWVIKAFELARQYFPDSTKLMINEYNIVNSGANAQDYLEIIHLLQERNLIDGIGVQAHAFSTINASTSGMISILDALVETGLPVQVCEMDIDGVEDQVQLDEYKRVFPVFWHHPSVEGITLWGWRHGLWRESQGAYLVDDRGAPRPSLAWLCNAVHHAKAPELVSPVFLRSVPRNPLLVWHPSDSASSYHIELSTNSNFNTNIVDTTVTDTVLQINTILAANYRFYWHVSPINDYGEGGFSELAFFTTGQDITSIDSYLNVPSEYILYRNYPNPFNPTTQINYELPITNYVDLSIYNVLGEKVVTLVSERKNAGYHQVEWDATGFSSGVYYYILRAGDFQQVRKMILVK